MTFSRKEIIANFKEKIAKKEPIIAGSAGIGLVAKMESLAGIDFILAYSSAVYRMDGVTASYSRMPYDDGTTMTLKLGRQILPRVEKTPVIGGVGAGDPYRIIEQVIDQMIEMGFSGITNVPTVGAETPTFIKHLDNGNIGFKVEVEMMQLCNKKDVFSVAYTYNDEQTKQMASAGADVICFNCGKTVGGMLGSSKSISLDKGCELIQKTYELTMAENPDAFMMFHGGPFWNGETVQYALSRTDAHGFAGGGCIEVTPIEAKMMKVVKSFQNLSL